jgi:hypothetical protein
MITSFEVGSVFKIIDQASPALRKILAQVKAVDVATAAVSKNLALIGKIDLGAASGQMAQLTREAAGLHVAFKDIPRSIGRMTSRAGALAGMTTALGDQAKVVGALGAEWRSVADAAASAAVATRSVSRSRVPAAAKVIQTSGVPLVAAPSLGGGGGAVPPIVPGGRRPGGRHGPQQGFHVSGLSTRIPGGHASFRGGGNAAMAALGAIGYGVYEEGEFEDAAFRAMFTAGVPTNNLQATAQFKALRDMIQNAATSTGAPIHQIEEATLTGIRQFAGMPWEDRMKVMPALLEAAAAEAKLKGGTTVEQGMESLTGLAHMTKNYTPEQIAKLASKFAYLSATSPLKLKQIEGAAGYAIPLLSSGLEIDPFDTLLLQATMQRAGILNTKSGTWIREMAKRAMPGTSLMSKMAFKKHEAALKEIGLVDDNDKPTWFNDAGQPDLIRMLDIAGENAHKIPLARRAGLEQSLFGTQGAGAFSVLADEKIRAQIKQLREEMDKFNTGYAFFDKYAQNSPVQQARVAWAETQRILMELGSAVLPPLNDALRQFSGTLKYLRDTLPKPEKGSFGEGMPPGAILGFFAGLPFGQPLLGMAAGGVLGGTYSKAKGLFGDPWGDTSAGPQPIQKQSNAESPSPTQTVQVTTVLNLDGRRLAEAVTDHIVKSGNGPAEGSPYPDTTRGGSSFDFALVP